MPETKTSKTTLSPKSLAQAIGVSESSVKRWVDDGRIAATRTAGGHRRIAATEALRFVRESGFLVVRPRLLGVGELEAIAGELSPGEEAEALYEFLVRGAGEQARGLLLSLFVRGRSVAQIVDGPLRQAMDRIGQAWRHEEPAIYHEHRATDIAIQAISRLRMLQQIPAGAPRAVGGAPSGDPYILPSLCAAAVLESRGLAAVNLGPETPLDSLRLAVEDLGARLVWLSVSSVADRERLRRDLRRLRSVLRERGVPLVMGGVKARSLRPGADDLLYVGSSMAELEALVLGLSLGAAGDSTAA